jgi:inhibitor of cysteine peptidase
MCHLTHYRVKSILILLIFLVLSCSSNNQQSSLPTADLDENFAVTFQEENPLSGEASVESIEIFQEEKPLSNEAPVESIEILIPAFFPAQVNVIARGFLPDDCTTIDQVTEDAVGDTLRVKIITARQTDKVCTKVIKPFEGVIPVNVANFLAGIYTVNVNSVTDTFELSRDNTIP